MLTMPEESYEQLAGIDVLVVNALRIATHPTHQNLEEALAVAQRIQAQEDDALATTQAAAQTESTDQADVLDDILDDIESALETNAEEYVNSFVQKGGE